MSWPLHRWVHGLGPFQQPPDVDAAHRRRQQAHRAQLREAAAHAVGDVEGLVALPLGDLNEEAPGLGGGGDDVALIVVPHRLFEHVQHDEVLAHGLRRAAGLGDDVEAGGGRIDHVQQRRHALRVDVVLDVQPGAAPLFLGSSL